MTEDPSAVCAQGSLVIKTTHPCLISLYSDILKNPGKISEYHPGYLMIISKL